VGDFERNQHVVMLVFVGGALGAVLREFSILMVPNLADNFPLDILDAMVSVIIAIGTIQAFVQGLRVMLLRSATGHERRDAWLHYARWLVAGLTFQLAADILAASIAPSWDELVRLARLKPIRSSRLTGASSS
jgi:uncharacterized membrane protein